MFGECVYRKCSEKGIAKLNGKDVCQDHFGTAIKAIGDKVPKREWKPPKQIMEDYNADL